MTDDATFRDDGHAGTFRSDAIEAGIAGDAAGAPDRDDEEVDALCKAALARFAEALRRAVAD